MCAAVHHGSVDAHVPDDPVSFGRDHQQPLPSGRLPHRSQTLPGRVDREPAMVRRTHTNKAHLRVARARSLDTVRVCVCVGREELVPDNVEKEGQARALLDQIISLLQSIAHQNANVVDKMKLMQISRNMVRLGLALGRSTTRHFPTRVKM